VQIVFGKRFDIDHFTLEYYHFYIIGKWVK